MISYSSKALQYLLATISCILLGRHLFAVSEPKDIVWDGSNGTLVFITYFFIIPGFLWVTLLWDKWLYNNLYTEDTVKKMSYESFQRIGTTVLGAIALYFIVRASIFPV